MKKFIIAVLLSILFSYALFYEEVNKYPILIVPLTLIGVFAFYSGGYFAKILKLC